MLQKQKLVNNTLLQEKDVDNMSFVKFNPGDESHARRRLGAHYVNINRGDIEVFKDCIGLYPEPVPQLVPRNKTLTLKFPHSIISKSRVLLLDISQEFREALGPCHFSRVLGVGTHDKILLRCRPRQEIDVNEPILRLYIEA